MGRFTRTLSIMGAAWQILREDKILLVLPVVSSICLGFVALSFGKFLEHTDNTLTFTVGMPSIELPAGDPVQLVGLFLFYLCSYAVMIFFNAALTICIYHRLEGNRISLSEGLAMALSRLPQIMGWALVSATLGMLLKVLERRFGMVGEIAADLFGLAWSLLTYCVLPILVVEGYGPIDALRQSAQLMKKTWGEQIIGEISYVLVSFLFSIPGVIIAAWGMVLFSSNRTVGIIMLMSATTYLLLLVVVITTLSSIFDTVLYRYARQGKVTDGFDRDVLSGIV